MAKNFWVVTVNYETGVPKQVISSSENEVEVKEYVEKKIKLTCVKEVVVETYEYGQGTLPKFVRTEHFNYTPGQ